MTTIEPAPIPETLQLRGPRRLMLSRKKWVRASLDRLTAARRVDPEPAVDGAPPGLFSRSHAMKREPMVFAVAGMVFGFVLGYMVASWDTRHVRLPPSAPGISLPPAPGRGAVPPAGAAASTRTS